MAGSGRGGPLRGGDAGGHRNLQGSGLVGVHCVLDSLGAAGSASRREFTIAVAGVTGVDGQREFDANSLPNFFESLPTPGAV